MSMNLVFKTPNGEYTDFPFQTPTNLTRKVLAETTTNKKLLLIKEQLEEWDWIEEDILSTLAKIKRKLDSGNTMVMI